MSNSSIWPKDRTLSDATSLGQSGPVSNGTEGVVHIPQSSSITGASPSDCLELYLGHSLVGRESYSSADIQLVFSTAQAIWAGNMIILLNKQWNKQTVIFQTIQFSLCHLFSLNLNVRLFYLNHRQDPVIICIYLNRHTWYASNQFVGNFTSKSN